MDNEDFEDMVITEMNHERGWDIDSMSGIGQISITLTECPNKAKEVAKIVEKTR